MPHRKPHLRAVEDTSATSDPGQREQALVSAALDGDSRAWARLYQDNFDSLYRDARYLSQDPNTAEELVQEAFALGLTRLSSYDGRGSFAGWIRGFILNLARRTWRKAERRERAHGRLEKIAQTVSGQGANPEQDLERRNRATALAMALETLPSSLRETFILRDVQGLPVDEVATRLETTPGNIRVRANRAREKLRTALTEMGAMEARS
jgi:RNA polymerase sigma-70 factor (ECF subfamily)